MLPAPTIPIRSLLLFLCTGYEMLILQTGLALVRAKFDRLRQLRVQP